MSQEGLSLTISGSCGKDPPYRPHSLGDGSKRRRGKGLKTVCIARRCTCVGSPQDDFCPIIFGRPFLNTLNAKIDCEKEIVSVSFGDVSHEFNFAQFPRQPHDK